MLKRYSLLLTTALLCLAVPALAQSTAPPANTSAACEQYKMRVIKPDENLDAKAVIQPPTTGVEYKGIVIDPCAQADAKVVKVPSRATGTPKPIPLLKLNPEPENKLLSPGEMLKKLTQPAAPKPKP